MRPTEIRPSARVAIAPVAHARFFAREELLVNMQDPQRNSVAMSAGQWRDIILRRSPCDYRTVAAP